MTKVNPTCQLFSIALNPPKFPKHETIKDENNYSRNPGLESHTNISHSLPYESMGIAWHVTKYAIFFKSCNDQR